MDNRANDETVRARVTVVIDVQASGASLESVRNAVTRSFGDAGNRSDARLVRVDAIEVVEPDVRSPAGQPVDRYGRTFWETASLSRLAAEQAVAPVSDVDALVGDFWPDNEGPDDFTAWLREQRRHG